MAHAVRLALRGHGGAEPNPMVGCVMVSPAGEVVGWGYHRRCGEAHAERVALDRAGPRAHGATAYVTLEPCNHHGRTPPCTEALVATGVARAVIARRDPNALAAGGADRLRAAGLNVEFMSDCRDAVVVSDPFVHRIQTGLPWVIAKWAQTLDGKVATRTGQSKWISGERSRRLVHRERGRLDAILTGIGTVLADDPLLTARHGHVRRVARRVVVDPQLRIPMSAQLITTVDQAPTSIACLDYVMQTQGEKARALRDAGVDVIDMPTERNGVGSELRIGDLLRELVRRWDITNMMVEAGPGLLTRLLSQHLVNEAWVFVAPVVYADDQALSAIRGTATTGLADHGRWKLISHHRRDNDILLRYRTQRSESG